MLRLRRGGRASRLANESRSQISLARTSLRNTRCGPGGLSLCFEYLQLQRCIRSDDKCRVLTHNENRSVRTGQGELAKRAFQKYFEVQHGVQLARFRRSLSGSKNAESTVRLKINRRMAPTRFLLYSVLSRKMVAGFLRMYTCKNTFLMLGVLLAVACMGWFKRRVWGWRLA